MRHVPVLALLLVACGNVPASPVAPTPSASAAPVAPSASATSSAAVVASPAAADAGVVAAAPPADVRCAARDCRVERANDHTMAELAATQADVGALEILGGRPKSLAPLAPLTKLYRFKIALCEGIVDRDFAFAKGWTELTELVLSNCDGFTSLAPLGTLPKLSNVELVNTQLRSLEGLRGAPLTKLRVQSGVTDLSALSAMTGLVQLTLSDLDVHELPSLAKLSKLETLEVWTTDLVRLPDLSSLGALKALRLSHVPKLARIDGLAALPALTELQLDWMGPLDLAALGKLDHVTFLHLEGTKPKDLLPLAAWKSLGVVIVADDTPPAQIAALKKAKPALRVATAHQAQLAAQGPGP